MTRYVDIPASETFTCCKMKTQRDWIGGGWNDRAASSTEELAVLRGPEEERPTADIVAVGRKRFENRSYFWVRLANGDERGVKVGEQPKDVQRMFKPFDKIGKGVSEGIHWIEVTR